MSMNSTKPTYAAWAADGAAAAVTAGLDLATPDQFKAFVTKLVGLAENRGQGTASTTTLDGSGKPA